MERCRQKNQKAIWTMNAHVEKQIQEYNTLNASLATSVCNCVWNNKKAIAAVGHLPGQFRVGCSERCLYSEKRTVVRAEHLFKEDHEFLSHIIQGLEW